MKKTLTLRLLPDEPRGHLTDGEVHLDVTDYRRTGPRTLVFDVEASDFDALVERLSGNVGG